MPVANACLAHHDAVVTDPGAVGVTKPDSEEPRQAVLRSDGKRGPPPRRAGAAAVPMKSSCKDTSHLFHGRLRGFRM